MEGRFSARVEQHQPFERVDRRPRSMSRYCGIRADVRYRQAGEENVKDQLPQWEAYRANANAANEANTTVITTVAMATPMLLKK